MGSSGQNIVDIVVGEEYSGEFFVIVRLMAFQPKDFGCGVSHGQVDAEFLDIAFLSS
jgi:hypothetical protein